MLVDQDEIDALLNQAESLATEVSVEVEKPAPPPVRPLPRRLPADPELARLFRLRVPVIVQLALRTMSIAEIRQFATGSIIEFEKSVDDNLDLLINNRRIGSGTCVKIGEHFGLRVSDIATRVQRIQSMGQ